MKKIFHYLIIFCFTGLISRENLCAQNSVNQIQLSDFSLQSSAVIKEDGTLLSTIQYQSKDYWFPVKVPTTVLTGLVAAKRINVEVIKQALQIF